VDERERMQTRGGGHRLEGESANQRKRAWMRGRQSIVLELEEWNESLSITHIIYRI
jgi:hypothetical protein